MNYRRALAVGQVQLLLHHRDRQAAVGGIQRAEYLVHMRLRRECALDKEVRDFLILLATHENSIGGFHGPAGATNLLARVLA